MSSVLGALFAVLVGLMGVGMVTHYERMSANNQLIAATAGEFSEILKAANQYVQANASALEGVATATTPATVTAAMLQNTGFLSHAVSATNPFGQTWSVQVLQPQPGALEALVVSSGGQQISQTMAPAIAAQAGKEGGGFIPYNGQYGSLNASAAQGAYGGWAVPMAGYANPGSGHLAGLVQNAGANQQQDYLYRDAVPGAPQLNTMATDLNMGSNNINNANVVNANQVNLPQGNNFHIDAQSIYGDGLNMALRTPGTVYVQTPDGTQFAPLEASQLSANYVKSFGEINADGNVSGQNFFSPNAYVQGSGNYTAVGGNSANGQLYANEYIDDNQASVNAQAGGNKSYLWASPSGAGVNTTGTVSADQAVTTNGQVWANGQITNGDIMRPGKVAWIGSSCGTPGAMAVEGNDNNGGEAVCYEGVWHAMGGLFTNTYQTGTYGGYANDQTFFVAPPTPRPMFLSSLCLSDGAPVYSLLTAEIFTMDSSNHVLSEALGAGGVSAQNIFNEPSVSAIIPPGDYAMVQVANASCSFLVNY